MTPRPLEAIAGFAQHLREAGLTVGIAEQQAMVHAALALCGDDARRVRAGWRAIACHRADDWRRYPQLFDDYWYPERVGGRVRVSGRTRPRPDLRQAVADMRRSMPEAAEGAGAAPAGAVPGADPAAHDAAPRAQGGASRNEPLERRSFAQHWTPQQLHALLRAVERIAQRLRLRLLRRQRLDDLHGRRLDMRRTLRRSLRSGGVPVQPAWRAPRRERPRVFVLVDVSRSMQTHAQVLLRIARAFAGVLDARVFVFHTRLCEVTALMRRDSAAVQEKINTITAGLGGGTRIATSVADFVRAHAKGQLGRGARVLIASDGFDSDAPGALSQQLAALRAHGAKLYWLHPTVARPASAALADCAALVTAFAPLHDLASLARLEDVLS